MHLARYPISGPWPGQLAILARPRGNDWLEDELRSLRASGVEFLVSLLELEEEKELGLADEGPVAEALGIRFFSFPIRDRSVPHSASTTLAVLAKIREALEAGKNVGVHCRQGIGRSTMIAAGLLMIAGVESEEAWTRVEASRGMRVPDTPEQRDWIIRALSENPAPARPR